MKTYTRRFAGYLLLSTALALIFGPFGGNPFSKPYHPDRSYVNTSRFEEMVRQRQAEEALAMGGIEQTEITDILLQPKIRFFRYILGAFFLGTGIYMLRRSYTRHAGIPINPRRGALAADVVCILFLCFAAYSALAWAIRFFLGVAPYLYDPTAMGMITIAFLPVTALLAFFVSNFSTQSIEITAEGIRIYYPDSESFSTWDNIQGIELKDTWTVAGSSEFTTARQMQTKLVLRTSNGNMELFEPGLKKIKSQVINRIRENAPERLHKDIAQLTGW